MFAASGSCPEVSATVTVDYYDVTPDDTASGEVCVGNTFNYEGIDYEVGSYDIPRTDINGCPYKTVLTVTAYDVTLDDTASGEVCLGNTFNYEGVDYEVGSYDIPRTDTNGCPYKTVLTVTAYDVTPDDTASGEVCVGNTFNYEGIEYAVGSHDIPRTDTNGCPYTTVLTVTAYDVTPDIVNDVTICKEDSYVWSITNESYTAADSPVVVNLIDDNGCPYTATLILNEEIAQDAGDDGTLLVCQGVIPTNEELFDALSGDPNEGGVWSGPINGVYKYLFEASGSCPEVSATVTLEYYDVTPDNTISGEVCEGNTFAYEGIEYEAGTHDIPMLDVNGCPYTTVLTITINEVDNIKDEVSICEGDNYLWSVTNETYTLADSPVVINLTDDNGCSYTATLIIEENLSLDAGENGTLTVCFGITPTYEELFDALNGMPDTGGIWTGPENGQYTYTFEAIGTCPGSSAIVKVYEYAKLDNIKDDVTVCHNESYLWEVDGETYYAEDSPVVREIIDSNGCTYSATLIINEYPITENITEEVVVCQYETYFWPLTGETYAAKHSPVKVVMEDDNGCSYIATLIINVAEQFQAYHPNIDPVCIEDGIIPLTGGQPEGGVYYGTGVIDNNDGTYSVDLAQLGVGVTGLYYILKQNTECETKSGFKVIVYDCCEDELAYAYAPSTNPENESCFLESNLLYNTDWGWTNGGLDMESIDELGDFNTYTIDLYADSENDCDPTDDGSSAELVGTVTLTREGDDIIVTYLIDDNSSELNYELGNVNAYLGCNAYPCKNNNINGENSNLRLCASTTNVEEFPYSGYSEDGNSVTLVVPITHLTSNNCLGSFYFIGRAEVELCQTFEDDRDQRIANDTHIIDFKAYPVPFKDIVTIAYDFDFETDVQLEIIDIRGNLLRSENDKNYVKNSQGKMTLNLSNVDSQILFVKITTSQGSVIKKIMSSHKK
jgi:hypothetical protein